MLKQATLQDGLLVFGELRIHRQQSGKNNDYEAEDEMTATFNPNHMKM